MVKKILLFIIAFIVWCLLNWLPDWQHLLVGIFVAWFVAFMVGGLFVNRPGYLIQPQRYLYFIFGYLPCFLWEVIRANIDVACRVLHPQLPIKPGIVKVKTSLQSDTALTFLANSITLTPGTMSVDIDRDNGVLYIHWINVQSVDVAKATQIIVERFEKMLKRIFD